MNTEKQVMYPLFVEVKPKNMYKLLPEIREDVD